MADGSLTRQLIGLVRRRSIERTALQRAALFVLDAVANALAARDSGAGQILRRRHQAEASDAGRVALLLGGLTHILEMDDLHARSVTHPGCVVVPAVLAVAGRERLSGRAALTAVLQGYEACCRIGNAVGPAHYRLWHSTATCGPFGSAMAIAHLLSLDEEQTTHALGNAGTQAAGLWQFLETGAMTKHLHAGRAAEAGVIAADLAALGFTGPPAILEGAKGFFAAACPDADPAAVLRSPDDPWALTTTSIKPWPSCRHTHPAIDAALELHGRLAGRRPRRIEVQTYRAALDVCDRPLPGSDYEAKFSLQHCVAAALSEGAIDFSSFDDDSRIRLEDLRATVRLSAAEPFDSAYPAAWGARLSADVGESAPVTVERRHCKGDPELPLSDAEMVAKARRLLAHGGLDGRQTDVVVNSVLGLADDRPVPTEHILRLLHGTTVH